MAEAPQGDFNNKDSSLVPDVLPSGRTEESNGVESQGGDIDESLW